MRFLRPKDSFVYNERDNIGDWGYDEVSAPDLKYLRHEVLFSSGTSVMWSLKSFHIPKKLVRETVTCDRI